MDQQGSAWDWSIDFLPIPDWLGWMVIAVAVLVFMIFVGGPLLLFLFEQVLLLLLAIAGALVRSLFRRPWAVEAMPAGDGAAGRTYDVVGLRAAWRARDAIARTIERSGSPPERLAAR